MNPDFVYWKSSTVKDVAVVTKLYGVQDVHDMAYGLPIAHRFPDTAEFRFDPEFKRNTLLADCLINVASMLLCSARLKDFIAAKNPEKVEYLPVRVVDIKGKPVDAPFFIVHPIEPVDCIDFAQSQVKRSAVDPDSILTVQHLEIDSSKVAPARLLLRPKGYANVILIRRTLMADIEAAGFTGAGWREIK
jgi:hypothetical protein